MKYYILCFVLLLATYKSQAQKFVSTKNNIVANSLAGSWKTDQIPEFKNTVLTFTPDSSLFDKIPSSQFKKSVLSNLTIYQTGHFVMKETLQNKEKNSAYFLATHEGNPVIVLFSPKGQESSVSLNGESFYLFIATSKNKGQDLMFLGGDRPDEKFSKFVRVK